MQGSIAVILSPYSMYGHSGAEWKIQSWSEVIGGPSGDETARSEASVWAACCHHSTYINIYNFHLIIDTFCFGGIFWHKLAF